MYGSLLLSIYVGHVYMVINYIDCVFTNVLNMMIIIIYSIYRHKLILHKDIVLFTPCKIR